MIDAWLLKATVPFDAARRSVFRTALGRAKLFALLTRRDSRLATLVSVQALMAFALALLCPVLLLVLGPVLLGIAHVAADVRHLVLRRRLPRALQTIVWAACLLLILLRGLAESHGAPLVVDRIEWMLVAVWTALFAALGGAAARSVRRGAAGVLIVSAIGLAALADPARARLVFVQAHNVMALVLWVALFRRRRRSVAIPLALVALGALLLGSGKLYGVTL
jgi:hypothetical protein